MALENLVDGMTGLQLANTIKNNFDKVLDAESAENKAENAGKSIKTDYDATRYIELQLADGTPVKMKMDVFCQAIAPVVAGIIGYSKATVIASGLQPNSSIEAYVPDCGMLMLDAGVGGSEYLYLKRYSSILEVGKTETENFKISVEFVSRNTIKVTSVGLEDTGVRLKYIDFKL